MFLPHEHENAPERHQVKIQRSSIFTTQRELKWRNGDPLQSRKAAEQTGLHESDSEISGILCPSRECCGFMQPAPFVETFNCGT
jgi:hypothetical protein